MYNPQQTASALGGPPRHRYFSEFGEQMNGEIDIQVMDSNGFKSLSAKKLVPLKEKKNRKLTQSLMFN